MKYLSDNPQSQDVIDSWLRFISELSEQNLDFKKLPSTFSELKRTVEEQTESEVSICKSDTCFIYKCNILFSGQPIDFRNRISRERMQKQ